MPEEIEVRVRFEFFAKAERPKRKDGSLVGDLDDDYWFNLSGVEKARIMREAADALTYPDKRFRCDVECMPLD